MPVYDDILAEMKITNGELQVIRVALERIERHVCPFPAPEHGRHTRCNVNNCPNKPTVLLDGGSPYCAEHGAIVIKDGFTSLRTLP